MSLTEVFLCPMVHACTALDAFLVATFFASLISINREQMVKVKTALENNRAKILRFDQPAVAKVAIRRSYPK